MGNHLERIADVFEACLRASGIFDRANRPLVEREVLRKENREWVVMAAGLDPARADDFFRHSGKRGSYASIPLTVSPGGRLSLLLVLRPYEPGREVLAAGHHITTYAPGQDIPFVLIREAHLRITHLPDNPVNLDAIRWEADLLESRKAPIEPWLGDWHKTIGFNPAHGPSHLHFNSPPKDLGRSPDPGGAVSDLRLAIGMPNPLALVLSLGSWLKRL